MALQFEAQLGLLERARDNYLENHHSTAMSTVVTEVLMEMLIDDLRRSRSKSLSASTKLKRAAFEKRVRSHPNYDPDVHELIPFGSIPEDIGKQLALFGYEDAVDGEDYVVRFGGPIARFRPNREGEGFVYLTATVMHVAKMYTSRFVEGVSVTASHVDFAQCASLCFCCGARFPTFDVNRRFCVNDQCYTNSFDPVGRDEYLAHLPVSEAKLTSREIPWECRTTIDPDITKTQEMPDLLETYRPYKTDHLRNAGLELGSPSLYHAPTLAASEKLAGEFAQVYVLDMSTYVVSNTLKDPKSWAVVNLALESGLKNLAVFTAGNSGLSLAKLVYAANRRLRSEMKVFAVVDQSVSDVIRQTLRAWGVDVLRLGIPAGSRGVPRREMWRRVNAHVHNRVSDAPTHGDWDVSEGWDGAGVMTYRGIFAHLFTQVQADYVLVPIGQGSLLLGAWLGLQDSQQRGTRLVGVVPVGESAVSGTSLEAASTAVVQSDIPHAAKLFGRFTPLVRCLDYLRQARDLWVIEVSAQMQRSAYLHGDIRCRIASEPSAVIAFGALRGDGKYTGLLERVGRASDARAAMESTVLVVNTGVGVFGENDARFLA